MPIVWSVANIVTPNCTQVGYRAVLCRRSRRHRHRSRPWDRPRTCARVRARRRQGRRERPRRRARRNRWRSSDRRRTSSTRSSRPAARPSRTPTTSPTGTARATSSAPRSTRSAASTCSSTTPASCATACCSRRARKSGTPSSACTSKGHFAPTRHATEYWRARSKAGEPVDARIINTSSGAGLMGSVGQGAYSAAKAGIAALTLVEAAEMARYGVTANAIAPAARTRMTEEVFADRMAAPDGGFDANDPANMSPLVVWLGSTESRGVTGRVFEVEGGMISVADGWQHGPQVDKGAPLGPADVGAAVQRAARRRPRRPRRSTARSSRARPRRRRCRRGGGRRAPGPTRHCSTGSRPPTATTSRSSTATSALTVDDLRPRVERVRGAAAGARRPAGRRRRVAAAELVGGGRALLGDLALRRDREPDHAEPAARTRSASSCARPGARSSRCRTSSAAPTTGALLHDAGFDGDRDRGPRRLVARAVPTARRTVAVSVDDPRRRAVDVGHDRRSEGRRAHAPDVARTRPTRSPPRTRCAAGESLLLPMPVTHVAGLTYGVLLPVTLGDHRGAHGHLGARARARPRSNAKRIAVMISTPVFMRTMIDHPRFAATDTHVVAAVLARRCGRRAGDGARRRAARSTAGASAPTARRSTRRSRPAASATIPSATRRPTDR